MKNNIKHGKAEIITEYPSGIRLIKFNNRYYTAYGRMFAVAGNHVEDPYNETCKMGHYGFCDWNTLSDMYLDE